MRREYEWLGEQPLHFYSRIQGGRWTKAHKKVGADSILALPRGGWPKAWAEYFHWPKQKGFAFTAYGELVCVEMAHEVCRRAEHFYLLWCEAGCELWEFEYDDTMVAAHEEVPACVEFVALLAPYHPAIPIVEEVRQLTPWFGPWVEDDEED